MATKELTFAQVEKLALKTVKEVLKNRMDFLITTEQIYSHCTRAEARKKVNEDVKECAHLIALNRDMAPEKIFGWYFGFNGYRKPRNLKYA